MTALDFFGLFGYLVNGLFGYLVNGLFGYLVTGYWLKLNHEFDTYSVFRSYFPIPVFGLRSPSSVSRLPSSVFLPSVSRLLKYETAP